MRGGLSLAGRGDTAGGAGRDYGGGSAEEAVMRGAAGLCKALLKQECSSNSQSENNWEYEIGWLVIYSLRKKDSEK